MRLFRVGGEYTPGSAGVKAYGGQAGKQVRMSWATSGRQEEVGFLTSRGGLWPWDTSLGRVWSGWPEGRAGLTRGAGSGGHGG